MTADDNRTGWGRKPWLVVAALIVVGVGLVLAADPLLRRLRQRGLLTDHRVLDPASAAGRRLDRQAAETLFAALRNPDSRMEYDEQAWVVLKPDRTYEYDWPEHERGRIVLRTNDRGFRDDEPTAIETDAYRILVTGDSHTEGAVDNHETYAHVLESLLTADLDQPVEVLNAGVGGTGPHNALAILEKHADLQPDLFIATLFVGNDFAEALRHSDLLTGRTARERDAEYFEIAEAAAERWPVIRAQGFGQAYLFRYRAGDADVALDVTVAVYEEIAAVCEERGIELLVVILPTKVDVEPDDDRQTTDELSAALRLEPADWDLNAELARRLAQRLADAGIATLDALAPLTDESRTTPLYWRADHHLNPNGHRVLAAVIHAAIRSTVAASVH